MALQSTIEWIFDPIPPSGAREGGIPSAHVFTPDLHTFVREVIQNAGDQRLSADTTVRVVFTLMELQGEDLQEFLRALAWDRLSPHLSAVAEANMPTISGRIQRGVDAASRGPLRLIRIDDFETHGLNGGEDEQGQNFNALCRNTLETMEAQPVRGGRGGSYGLGKTVLWSFSELSTVIFSSRPSKTRQRELRLFGRCELPTHDCMYQDWSGLGFFGSPDPVVNPKRSVSVWGKAAENLAPLLQLARPQAAGTSIVVVGFHEPAEEQTRDLRDIAKDIARSAGLWFWPCLIDTPPRLRIEVRAIGRGGTNAFSAVVVPPAEAQPFVDASAAASPTEHLNAEADVAHQNISVRIPPRRGSGVRQDSPSLASNARLRVRRGAEADDSTKKNQVALIRGAGMVVQYRPLVSGLFEYPLFAVLEVGTAAGGTEGHHAAEDFFRDAEPPSHNNWEHTAQRIAANYERGARARLQELWDSVGKALASFASTRPVDQAPGPTDLAGLFRLSGSGGGDGERSFDVTDLSAAFDGLHWSFHGRVRVRATPDRGWRVAIRVYASAESGRGGILPIEKLKLSTGSATIGAEGSAIVRIASPERVVVFDGTTGLNDLAVMVGARARARVEVRPSFEEVLR